MNETSTTKDQFLTGEIAKELDFYRIRETISQYTASEEGRNLILKREASSDKESVTLMKNYSRQWTTYLNAQKSSCITPWPAIKHLFPVLAIQGSQLTLEQIYALGQFCISCSKVGDAIKLASYDIPVEDLLKLVQTIPLLTDAEREIFSIITEEGDIRDLPSIRAIRSRIVKLHREIENSIRSYTSDPALASALQSTVPAYRQDRELLAVRSDHSNAIKGIVHEVSASGQTIYVEPEEVVRANNELIQAEAELQSEIRKILVTLTEKLGEYRHDFEEAHKAMLILDVTFAASRYQKACNGIFAEDCDLTREPPAIFGARHPLLGEKAVPVDIRFADGKRVLIITGANTGGKTVTLKTVALFALLNQAAFPIPAEDGTRLPFFTSVFADIGDEQSIDESLSTFSSHMKKTAQMILNANDTSLVLLDELASGTDPQEGGAIAMSVLDNLIEKNSFVIVTTHHGILKNYGYTNPKCINASVEFSSETLSPTYHLVMGVPGESHAIDIARRSGLPEFIVEKARNYISTQQSDVSTLIRGLSQKHLELDEILRNEKIKEMQNVEKELRLHRRELSLKEKEVELREAEHKQSSIFLRETRKKLENLVRELREGEINREKTLRVKNFIAELTEDVDQQVVDIENTKYALDEEQEQLKREEQNAQRILDNGMKFTKAKEHKGSSNKKTKKRLSNTEALATVQASQYSNAKTENRSKKAEKVREIQLKAGVEVYAGKARRKGTIVQQNRDGSFIVQFGSMKMSVPKKQLMPVPSEDLPAKADYIVERSDTTVDTENRPAFELRLLGMRYEEAMKSLERQLDLCLMHNFKNFSIVHGKGNGILQQGVHSYLSHYPGIKDFHFAPPEEGGSGKTYVALI